MRVPEIPSQHQTEFNVAPSAGVTQGRKRLSERHLQDSGLPGRLLQQDLEHLPLFCLRLVLKQVPDLFDQHSQINPVSGVPCGCCLNFVDFQSKLRLLLSIFLRLAIICLEIYASVQPILVEQIRLPWQRLSSL